MCIPMKFKSPIVFAVVLAALFIAGILFGKMMGKTKVETFDDTYSGILNTVQDFSNSPKVLPPVPQNEGVTTHDDWCGAFNC